MLPLPLLILLLAPPASSPAGDPELDWLLEQSTPATRPATRSTTRPTQPASPLEAPGNPSARGGVVTLSDGTLVRGQVATTRDKPLRVWDEPARRYREVPWPLVRSIEAVVLWERDEPQFQFRESGSDVKVFTGRTYPARQAEHVVTLVNGQTIRGRLAAPLFVRTDAGERRFILHDRSKGEVGQSLRDLVYVRRVELE